MVPLVQLNGCQRVFWQYFYFGRLSTGIHNKCQNPWTLIIVANGTLYFKILFYLYNLVTYQFLPIILLMYFVSCILCNDQVQAIVRVWTIQRLRASMAGGVQDDRAATWLARGCCRLPRHPSCTGPSHYVLDVGIDNSAHISQEFCPIWDVSLKSTPRQSDLTTVPNVWTARTLSYCLLKMHYKFPNIHLSCIQNHLSGLQNKWIFHALVF